MRGYSQVLGLIAAGLATVFATQAAANEVGIRIGYPSGMNGQIPVVLQKAGLAEKHGLKAEFTPFQYGPPMMEGLVSGELDAVVTSFLPPLNLAARAPGSIKFVATLGQSSHSLLVPKDSAANAIPDLKGQKIGVSFNSESHLDLLQALKELGLDAKKDVELVNLQPGELPAALEQGLVSGAVIRQPQTSRLEESAGAKRIRSWPFRFTSIVRSEFLEKNPDAVKRYVEAIKDAVYYITSNPEESATWFAESLRIDPSVVKALSTENPLYNVKTREEIKVEIDDAFKKELADRLEAGLSYGIVKSAVDPVSLTQ
jgi:ABC-type nitrate/sulfonate/bicarbonate transport system substrate-binding protein